MNDNSGIDSRINEVIERLGLSVKCHEKLNLCPPKAEVTGSNPVGCAISVLRTPNAADSTL